MENDEFLKERAKGVELGSRKDIEDIVAGEFDFDNKYIIWVSDFFINEVTGGAELCDDAAISYLKTLGQYKVKTIHSRDVTEKFIKENKENLFIISNFTQLGPDNIDTFYKKNIKYVHYNNEYLETIYEDGTSYKNLYCHFQKRKFNIVLNNLNDFFITENTFQNN